MENFMKKVLLVWLLFVNISSLYALTVGFSGTVISVLDPDDYIDGRISPGDPFSGSVTYDFSSYTLIEHPQLAIYNYATAPNAITVTVNGFVFATNPDGGTLRISINIDETRDDQVLYFGSQSSNIFMGEVMDLSSLYWQLNDSTKTALSSLDLPTTPSDVSDFTVNRLVISRLADGVHEIGYDIVGEVFFTEDSTPAVPEPLTCVLCGIGFLIAGTRFRYGN